MVQFSGLFWASCCCTYCPLDFFFFLFKFHKHLILVSVLDPETILGIMSSVCPG